MEGQGGKEPSRDGPLTGLALHGGVLGQKLGGGAFGEVYAMDLPRGERLAVKAICAPGAMQDRVRAEIDALASSAHKNILRYLWHEQGTGVHHEYVFVATERCSHSFEDAMDSVPPGLRRIARAWEEVPRLVSDSVEGLNHLHGQSPPLIHRDIKPANILLAPAGVWRVADLGIVRALDPQMSVAPDPTLIFTAAFVAPDMARTKSISIAIDWFSLGATVQWAFTGELPWPGFENAYFLLEHMRKHRPHISEQLPQEWVPFVTAALDVDARRRASWDYNTLISWQPGDVPVGQKRVAPRPARAPRDDQRTVRSPHLTPPGPGTTGPDPAAPTQRKAGDESTQQMGAGRTEILRRQRTGAPTLSPTHVMVRSLTIFAVVLVVVAVLILANRS